jgi:GDP-4-dehydro-6-deoxy-D-mannose reductase
MRCLVTGITGFVGQHLAKLLLQDGCQIAGVANDDVRLEEAAGLKQYCCELTNSEELAAIVQQFQPDQVYHLAAFASPAESLTKERAVYDINFGGTLNLLNALRCHAPAARVLLVGSTQCYGLVSEAELPILETQPFAPRNPYAVSKAAADLLGFQFFARYGMHVVRARPANHTGPGQSAAYVCSDFARQMARIQLGLDPPELRVGNIDVFRDFCDVRDVVQAYRSLLAKGRAGEAYNIGSGQAIRLREIVDILASFCSRAVKVTVDAKRVRSDDAKVLYAGTEKIAQEIGWQPQYKMIDTLRDLFDYWISHLRAA